MEVGIDLDGPLCDTFAPFLEFHNQRYGTKTKLSDLKQHDLSSHLDTTYEKLKERFHIFFTEQGNSLLPAVDSQKSVAFLKKSHFGLHVITNRPTHFDAYTKQWVESHFPRAFTSINLTNIESVSGSAPKDKFDYSKDLDVRVLLEDSLENAILCARRSKEEKYPLKVILLDYPWNRFAPDPEGVVRVANWQEAVRETFPR